MLKDTIDVIKSAEKDADNYIISAKENAVIKKEDIKKDALKTKEESIAKAKEMAAKEMDELVAKCKTVDENKDREIANEVEDLKSKARTKMPQVVELVKKSIG